MLPVVPTIGADGITSLKGITVELNRWNRAPQPEAHVPR